MSLSSPYTDSSFIACARDLLSRHTRLLHPSDQEVSTLRAGLSQQSSASIATERNIDGADGRWTADLFMQDLLPTALFDGALSLTDPTSSIQPTPSENFPIFTSRLPSTSGIESDLEGDKPRNTSAVESALPWFISGSTYQRICLEIQRHSEILPVGYALPSKNTLSRNLEAYFRCVQELLPFVHPATFSAERKDVELVLAVAVLGALNRFEYSGAVDLYSVARKILLEKTRLEDLQLSSDLLAGEGSVRKSGGLDRLQSFILLTYYASWTNKDILPGALAMSRQLKSLVTQYELAKADETREHTDWLSWITSEQERRTLFAAYVLSNLHSIAFCIPPLILSHEVDILLPSDAECWRSSTARQWRRYHLPVKESFGEALHHLRHGGESLGEEGRSSFSNYLLIHGLIQEIMLARQRSSEPLQPEAIESFENALCAWQRSWELTRDSTLDPLAANEPLGLTATALLRIAYIRLNTSFNLGQNLLSHDSRSIVTARESVRRSPSTDKAVLQAAHALSLPVRLGLELTARIKLPFRSIENSLCSLDCALLLKDWLEVIAALVNCSGIEGLRPAEKILLQIICGIVQETNLAELPNNFEDEASQITRLATKVVKIWVKIFEGDHILGIDKVISSGLLLLAGEDT